MPRRAARQDDNHRAIVAALRAAGASVHNTHQLPGFVDIVVGRKGRNYLLEIKDGNKARCRHKLTTLEQAFHDSWRGQVATVRTIAEAFAAVDIPYDAAPPGAAPCASS